MVTSAKLSLISLIVTIESVLLLVFNNDENLLGFGLPVLEVL